MSADEVIIEGGQDGAHLRVKWYTLLLALVTLHVGELKFCQWWLDQHIQNNYMAKSELLTQFAERDARAADLARQVVQSASDIRSQRQTQDVLQGNQERMVAGLEKVSDKIDGLQRFLLEQRKTTP